MAASAAADGLPLAVARTASFAVQLPLLPLNACVAVLDHVQSQLAPPTSASASASISVPYPYPYQWVECACVSLHDHMQALSMQVDHSVVHSRNTKFDKGHASACLAARDAAVSLGHVLQHLIAATEPPSPGAGDRGTAPVLTQESAEAGSEDEDIATLMKSRTTKSRGRPGSSTQAADELAQEARRDNAAIHSVAVTLSRCALMAATSRTLDTVDDTTGLKRSAGALRSYLSWRIADETRSDSFDGAREALRTLATLRDCVHGPEAVLASPTRLQCHNDSVGSSELDDVLTSDLALQCFLHSRSDTACGCLALCLWVQLTHPN